MALLKTFNGIKIGSTTTNYWLSGSSTSTQTNYLTMLGSRNYALVEDEHTQKLYLADSTNDAVNLSPDFDKELSFANFFKGNLRHSFNKGMLFTSKPALSCSLDFDSTENDEEIYSSVYMNLGLKLNLDLDQVYSQGNLKTFTIGSEKYTLIVLPHQDGDSGGLQSSSYNTAPGSRIILIHGDDLSSATYIEHSEPTLNLNLLSVNPAQKLIYLIGAFEGNRNTSDGEGFSNAYAEQLVVAVPFNTLADDGVFSFDARKDLLVYTSYINSQGFKNGSYTNLFYLGRDSNANDCFGMINSHPDMNSNDSIDIVFLKIDYASFASASAYTTLNNLRMSYLNCFTAYTVSLGADPNTATDYARQQNAIPSRLYNFDPATPNDLWFYIPLFKNNGNLAPIAINWDKSEATWSSAFTVTQDLLSSVSIEGDTNGDTSNHIVNPNTHLSTLSDYAASFEAYISTYLTSTNTLHFTFNYFSKELRDQVNPNLTNLLDNTLSFAVDTNDPTSLTYENKSVIPNINSLLVKDYVNNTYQELVCLCSDGYRAYNYTVANGWTQAHFEAGRFTEFTMDSYNRRWAISNPPASGGDQLVLSGYAYYNLYNVELHLISQVLPYTTSIEFTNPTVTYSGTDINETLKVNAYDSNGARIAVDVLLTIEGSNMEFANSASSTTVTTSVAQDTTVAITITGPGYANVSASFDI